MVAPSTRHVEPRRLRLARVLAAATRGELGADLDIDPLRLARLEAGTSFATEIELRQLATRLGVTRDFFLSPILREVDEEETHFRCKQSARQLARRRALAHVTLLDELLCTLDNRVSLPRLQLPNCAGQDPEAAATECRTSWGISQHGALEDIQREAELSGVFVVDGPSDLMVDVDAFSARMSTETAAIVLNPSDPPSRNAFNIAHEVGHLVLHEGRETGDRQTENEADRFASALLMPREGFSASWLRGPGRLDQAWLMQMKSWWRVSLQALVRRARDLGLIDYRTYELWFKMVSKRGWRKSEPGEFEWPKPKLLQDTIKAVGHHFNFGPNDLAESMGVQLPLLEQLCGLRLSSKDGTQEGTSTAQLNVVDLQAFRRPMKA